uniref:Uncharacterized protein n=1 Tax=Haptolina ericina TaxID=156174 RepID=A0A7S3F0Z5_9EUKA
MQLHLVELEALPPLVAIMRSHPSPALRTKALYALGTMTRNCAEAQVQFAAADGMGALVAAISEAGAPPGVVRKSLALLTDLLQEALHAKEAADGADESEMDASGSPSGTLVQNELAEQLMTATAHNASGLCDAILACLRAEDRDTVEKAVQAMLRLVRTGVLVKRQSGGACNVGDIRKELASAQKRCVEALSQPSADAEDEITELLTEDCAAVDELLIMVS